MSLDIRVYAILDTGNVPYDVNLFDGNIYFTAMPYFQEAGVYEIFKTWGNRQCHVFVEPLRKACADMQARKIDYLKINSNIELYDTALQLLQDLLQACVDFPKCRVHFGW